MIADFDIEFPFVDSILDASNWARESVVFLHFETVIIFLGKHVQVESCLLPVSYFLEGRSRESECASGPRVVYKFTVEPGGKSMNLSVLIYLKWVLTWEIDITHFHFVEIKVQNLAHIRHYLGRGHFIDLRLFHNSGLHAAHVEAVYILPVSHLLLVMLRILKGSNIHFDFVWPNGTFPIRL